jgi:glycerophosphoryl diester phosphodiesterase
LQALFHGSKVTFAMLVIGHRGASADHQENTLDAIDGAARQGAHGVEVDLRRTADGAVAIRHDPTLPDGRLVAGLARKELPAWVPTLDGVLGACAGFDLVNLEIKNWPGEPDFDPHESVAGAVVDSLRDAGALRAHVLVSSFHLPTIDRIRQLDPQLATGWLTINLPVAVPMLEALAERGHRAVHPHHAFVDGALVEAAHHLGLAVNTWTVDEPERIRTLRDLGADAVITNVPEVAVRALTESHL